MIESMDFRIERGEMFADEPTVALRITLLDHNGEATHKSFEQMRATPNLTILAESLREMADWVERQG